MTEELNSELLTIVDPVSELYNQNQLLRRLRENMAVCDRGHKSMALVLWDIDGFMDFNNRFGQSIGDVFLKKVADVIKGSVRVYDEAFRFGPDEFCAILSPCDQKTADDVTQRVGEAVSKLVFTDDPAYTGVAFSISAGVSFYPTHGRLPDALIHAAQQALFQVRPKFR